MRELSYPSAQAVLDWASNHLAHLRKHTFEVLEVSKPVSPDAAVNLARIVSKLSPMVGNLIEFNVVEYLDKQDGMAGYGEWIRQDPGFPDAIFQGLVQPTPGLEIKAWFPLATEITARFKDSQERFALGNINVAIVAWVPESVIYGQPKILDVGIFSGQSVAAARDTHYHNPPDYLVIEPEDTAGRTQNLQQSNTAGYKFQGHSDRERREQLFREAQDVVRGWGPEGRTYSTSPEYQAQLRSLMSRFSYRLDTNFAKLDRIAHQGIQDFKSRVLSGHLRGRAIDDWRRLLNTDNMDMLRRVLASELSIGEAPPEALVD